jgi:oligopeptide/dipeptide ABC transporter ATP-binding protein
MKSDPLIETVGLKKYFPLRRGWLGSPRGWVRAVDGVSLKIERGRTLGLVGETGSGKSTLGRLILRLLPADGGEVRFEGEDLLKWKGRRLKRIRQRMQIIFQDPYGSLNPRMKVGEIVAEGLKIFHRGGKKEIEERVAELLRRVGLSPAARDLYPHEFSGGQRQRIGIARAIALNPSFIVCDEPVSSLDVSVQAQVLNLLSDLQKELNLTYLFIAHDLSVVEQVCDRVAVMYRGRVVEEAPGPRLYQNPLHPYTILLLRSLPVPDPAVHSLPSWSAEEERGQAADGGGCSFAARCPRAEEICRRESPELREAAPGHRVACHRVDRRGIAPLEVSY